MQGTGTLVGAPTALPEQPAGASDGGYQLGFVDTEIAAVVASVLGDGLGVAYSIDPQVKGTMSLQAVRPLSRDEVLISLEAALRLQGIALIENAGAYRVVPLKDAPRQVSALDAAGTRRPGFGIQIVPLRYVSATDMEKVLRPLAGESSILRIDEGRNLLLLAGTSQELASLVAAVRTFDVDWLAGMSFALFPIEYTDADTMAQELQAVFADAKSPIANVVRLVPLPRLNSLMVVTPQPEYLKRIESWIRQLDIGVRTPGRRVYVYDLQNAKATDVARSLNQILSLTSDSGGFDTGPAAGSIGADDGLAAERSGSRTAPAVASTDAAAGIAQAGSLKIVANEESNSLLVLATPAEFTVIENAIKQIDVQPLQVLIEASLAEVTLNDTLRFGLQWAYESSNGPIVLSEASNGAISPAFPGFSYLYTGSQSIQAVLNALETLTDVDVLSSPKLLVLNNREARLQVGDQVPVATQSSVSTVGGNAPIINAVELRDTGVILEITPRVNKTGLVLLDIAQEVSNVVGTTTSTINSPTIQQRRINSSVAVRDGETIALGGLIRDSRNKGRGGVPLLRRIPVVGTLFGSTSYERRRSELIVLITPRVIRSSSDLGRSMDELRDQFKSLQKALPQWQPSATAPPSAPPPSQ
jgi:general secretion pathway protein D